MLVSLVIARYDRRWLTASGIALAVLANALCIVFVEYEQVLWLRVLAGIGSGIYTAIAVATLGGYVSATFLADPITMVKDGWELLTRHGFLFDIGMTIWRVVGGFVVTDRMLEMFGRGRPDTRRQDDV